MRFLLDTHVLLWWLSDSSRLGPHAREVLASRDHEIFVSASSIWEMGIKSALGKLKLGSTLDELVNGLPADGFEQLPIDWQHSLEVSRLPAIHRDPFDRIMIAQARVERLALITADAKIGQYDVETLSAS